MIGGDADVAAGCARHDFRTPDSLMRSVHEQQPHPPQEMMQNAQLMREHPEHFMRQRLLFEQHEQLVREVPDAPNVQPHPFPHQPQPQQNLIQLTVSTQRASPFATGAPFIANTVQPAPQTLAPPPVAAPMMAPQAQPDFGLSPPVHPEVLGWVPVAQLPPPQHMPLAPAPPVQVIPAQMISAPFQNVPIQQTQHVLPHQSIAPSVVEQSACIARNLPNIPLDYTIQHHIQSQSDLVLFVDNLVTAALHCSSPDENFDKYTQQLQELEGKVPSVSSTSVLSHVCLAQSNAIGAQLIRTTIPPPDVHSLHACLTKLRIFMILIGRLFLKRLVPPSLVESIIWDFLQGWPQEYAIECVCELLVSIGFALEFFADYSKQLEHICSKLQGLVGTKRPDGDYFYSGHVQSVVQQLLTTRSAGWRQERHREASQAAEFPNPTTPSTDWRGSVSEQVEETCWNDVSQHTDEGMGMEEEEEEKEPVANKEQNLSELLAKLMELEDDTPAKEKQNDKPTHSADRAYEESVFKSLIDPGVHQASASAAAAVASVASEASAALASAATPPTAAPAVPSSAPAVPVSTPGAPVVLPVAAPPVAPAAPPAPAVSAASPAAPPDFEPATEFNLALLSDNRRLRIGESDTGRADSAVAVGNVPAKASAPTETNADVQPAAVLQVTEIDIALLSDNRRLRNVDKGTKRADPVSNNGKRTGDDAPKAHIFTGAAAPRPAAPVSGRAAAHPPAKIPWQPSLRHPCVPSILPAPVTAITVGGDSGSHLPTSSFASDPLAGAADPWAAVTLQGPTTDSQPHADAWNTWAAVAGSKQQEATSVPRWKPWAEVLREDHEEKKLDRLFEMLDLEKRGFLDQSETEVVFSCAGVFDATSFNAAFAHEGGLDRTAFEYLLRTSGSKLGLSIDDFYTACEGPEID